MPAQSINAPLTKVSRADVKKLRLQIRTILLQEKIQADAVQKPMLLLVGEHHESAESALIESIIQSEARTLGVQNLALELANEKSDIEFMSKHLFFNVGRNFSFINARLNDDTIHFVDTHATKMLETLHDPAKRNTSDPYWLKKRNENIAANLSNINKPVLMITGLSHIEGLVRRGNNFGTHHVVTSVPTFGVMAA